MIISPQARSTARLWTEQFILAEELALSTRVSDLQVLPSAQQRLREVSGHLASLLVEANDWDPDDPAAVRQISAFFDGALDRRHGNRARFWGTFIAPMSPGV